MKQESLEVCMYMFTSRDFLLDAKVSMTELTTVNMKLTSIGNEKHLIQFTLSNLQYVLIGFDS